MTGCLLMMPFILFAQTQKISGTVKDDAGKPVQGVSVTVKNKPGGTQTDENGLYTISAGKGAVVRFTNVGFEAQEITVGNGTRYDIQLKSKSDSLNEVVVVGYGTQRKTSMTGAVSVVDKKFLENRPVTNAVDALQGAAPGLVITRTNGQPGKEGWNLNVRGFSSLNGLNQPLVIIDGVEGDLIQLNPNDIETISVLKDAAAAAIYGAKSSGGVVIVTTKKGSGRMTLTYNGLYTIKKPYSIPDRVPAWRDAEMRNIANHNAGQGDTYTPQQIGWLKSSDSNFIYNATPPTLNGFYYSVDPIAAVLRKSSPSQTHNISVTGGNSQTQYLFSLGYYDANGVFKMGPDSYKRINARLNLSTRFNNIFSLDSRVSFTDSKTNASSGSVNGDYGLLYNVYQLRAYYPTTFPGHPELYTNTTANILQNGGYNNINQPQFDGVFTLKAENLVKGLTLRAVYSPHFIQLNNDIYAKTYTNWIFDTNGNPVAGTYGNNPNYINKSRISTFSHDIQGLADYDWSIGNDHHFHVLGGFQYQYYNYDSISAQTKALITGSVPSLNTGSNPLVPPVVADNIQDNAWVSFFGKFSYSFKDKYFAEATLRNDASSRLAPGNRSQTFPSLSLAWRISKENWFSQALPFFNEFKLRGSWGKLGNAQLGYPFQNNYNYIAQLNNAPVAYPFNNLANPTLYQSALPSSSLGWETIATTNGGVDFSMLRNRLTASFDYFIRKNDNMLIVVNQPAVLGVTPSTSNGASMKTWGWETTIGWRDRIGSLNYWVSLNLSDNQNKITRYNGNIVVQQGINKAITGYPVNAVFGYADEGYFATAADVSKHAFQDTRTGPGDIMYKDINGDGKINGGSNTLADHGDLQYLGNTSPRYNFGFTLGAQWKGFDVSAFFQGVGKRAMYLYAYSIMPYVQTWRSAWQINEDFWTPGHQDARFPRLYTGGTQNTVVSSHWVQNAAYIRLKNLQVGYTLPQQVLSKVKIKAARIFFTGQDIWEKNKMWYKYYDAENPNNADFNYPLFRSYAVGLNVTF